MPLSKNSNLLVVMVIRLLESATYDAGDNDNVGHVSNNTGNQPQKPFNKNKLTNNRKLVMHLLRITFNYCKISRLLWSK